MELLVPNLFQQFTEEGLWLRTPSNYDYQCSLLEGPHASADSKQINRHTPNTHLLNKILSASIGFQGQPKPDDIVRKSCYDFQRSLVCERREMSTYNYCFAS